MKNQETSMERMDHYFSGKSEGEKWIIILLLAGVVGYILYLYLFPYAESKYKASFSEKTRLEKKIREERLYLQSITVNGDRNFYVKKYDRDIAKKKAQIDNYNQRIALLNQSFQRLAAVLFNQENWSRFLNSITERAHKNDVTIRAIQSNYVRKGGDFGHVLEMGIQCEGDFQGLLAFINDLEQNKLVTDVYHSEFRVAPDGTALVSDLNVSVWGVNR